MEAVKAARARVLTEGILALVTVGSFHNVGCVCLCVWKGVPFAKFEPASWEGEVVKRVVVYRKLVE